MYPGSSSDIGPCVFASHADEEDAHPGQTRFAALRTFLRRMSGFAARDDDAGWSAYARCGATLMSTGGSSTAAVLSIGMSVVVNAPAEDVVVVGWGGASQDALRQTFFQPYVASTGNNIIEDSWNGGVGTLRAKVQGGSVAWDLVQVESEELILGCEEGLFVAIGWDKIGGRESYIDAGANECGVGALGWAIVLAYDGDTLTEDGPKSWKDFFDTSAYPGKRALRKGPKFNLEFALYADGVPVENIYSALATEEGGVGLTLIRHAARLQGNATTLSATITS